MTVTDAKDVEFAGDTVIDVPTNRPVTLADVAEASGVAASTVSRALSNPGRVNVRTRERIERVARSLGYVPNSQARALLTGKTGAIAVLVSDVTNPFYFDMIRGAQQQSRAAGYTQLLVDTEESEELEDSMLHTLRRSFDGAVLAASRLTDRRLSVLASEMPIVAINRQTAGVPSVFIDTPHGMDQAIEHLISLGHRSLVYVSGPDTSWPNEGRWRAFLRARNRFGVNVQRIGPFSPRTNAGAAAADAVINCMASLEDGGAAATACVAFNDLLAIGMLGRFRERGIEVPRDLSVVGCDDIFGADFCNPPLTTLSAPIEQAGRIAVSMLLSRFASDDEQEATAGVRRPVTLPTHLIVRSSTGPTPRS